ncbi:MAG: hypothetical protein Q7S77_00555 [Candidatus Staskawiczbacteria bacterium]|nr:hypothetical protein [Candidatus Staskawiczbacteria bacterium]
MNEKGPELGQNEEKNENTEEKKFNSKELFDYLINFGFENWKNKPDFERELEQAGVEKENVELAEKMMTCITLVNKLVFQDQVELAFSASKEKTGNFIQYIPEKEKQNEAYWINVDYFGDTIREIIKENRKVFLDENGKLLKLKDEKEAHSVSFEELILGIAIHEVRHRLQYKRDIKMIGRGDKVLCDGIYIDDEFINLQDSFIKGQKFKRKKDHDTHKEFYDRKKSKEEIDAVIVEKIAVSRLHHKQTSLEQLKELVTIEP